MLKNTVTVPVVGADKVILGPNMRRKGIVISHNGAAFGSVMFGQSATDASGSVVGYPVQNGVAPLILNEATVGDAITQELHAVMSAGGATFTVTEFFH